MIQREKLILDAEIRTQSLTITPSGSGDNRSLFTALREVISSAPGEGLGGCRVTLDAAKQKRAERLLGGVKVQELSRLISKIFMEQNEILPDSFFNGYEKNDILAFLEICRRIYVSKSAGNPPAKPKIEKTRKDTAISPRKKIQPQQKWSFQNFEIIKIRNDLDKGDAACAEFVLSHQQECPAVNRKVLVALAEQIVMGRQKIE